MALTGSYYCDAIGYTFQKAYVRILKVTHNDEQEPSTPTVVLQCEIYPEEATRRKTFKILQTATITFDVSNPDVEVIDQPTAYAALKRHYPFNAMQDS